MLQATFSVPLAIVDGKRNRGINLPDWIQILPRGREITAADKRKIKLGKIDQLLANFRERGMIPLDFKHASLNVPYEARLAEPPKRPEDPEADESAGWIVDLDASAIEEEGVWGKVEWTPKGAFAVMSKKFRFGSPELLQDDDFEAVHLLSVGLVKEHALTGLQAIYSVQRGEKNDMEKIAQALGVAANEDAILAKLAELTSRLSALEQGKKDEEDARVNAEVASLTEKIEAREKEIAAKEKALVEKQIDHELHIACHVEKKITPAELPKYKKVCVDSGVEFFRELISGKEKLIPDGAIATFSVSKSPLGKVTLTPHQQTVARKNKMTDEQYAALLEPTEGVS